MRQLVAKEISKEGLKVVFSVMYDVALSEIFSNICLLGWTTRSWVLSIGISLGIEVRPVVEMMCGWAGCSLLGMEEVRGTELGR